MNYSPNNHVYMNSLKHLMLGAGVVTALFSACAGKDAQLTVSGLNPAAFDSTINGKKTELITLKNNNGMEVCLTNYGGRVVSLVVPDKNGTPTDVVCSYDNIAQYADTLNTPSDYGSTVGRYANRIKDGKITILKSDTAVSKGIKELKEYVKIVENHNYITYNLRKNDNGNCLHGGGNTGWMNKVYDITAKTDTSVTFAITAPDGENGFPGNVKATATYTVTSDNALDIVFEATTDKRTVINMTNHSYFNLTGDLSKAGTNQIMYINADYFTPADSLYIPTGEIRSVYGTPMDFTKKHAIGETIGNTFFDQIKNAGGYDHNWVLNTKGDDKVVAASLYAPNNGIFMQVYTNEPGMQVYTGNFQGTGIACKHGVKYPKHVSVCFESQKFPDSPTKYNAKTKGWEVSNPFLNPGEKYHSHLVYKFSVK